MLKQIQVADLNLNPVTKHELLEELSRRIKSNEKTFLTTLYSEFLYHSLLDRDILELLNKANLAIADGIGVLWAERFLSIKFRSSSFIGKILEAWLQVVWSGAGILLRPKSIYKVFPEKIVGADLFWDLASLAAHENLTIYLVGWYDQQTEKVKTVLEERFPKIKIVGFSNSNPEDPKLVEKINLVNPDILMVGFGRIKQEKWIDKHFNQLQIKLAVGLGGSFDYAIGKRFAPPQIIRKAGLEWFYRLFTQPHRVKRIYQAVWGLITSLIKYKVFESYGYRPNVVAVVINQDNKIWLSKRGASHPGHGSLIPADASYWQFVQGGIDSNEDIVKAARRELQEETGITSVEYLGTADYIHKYKWSNALRSIRWTLGHKNFQYKGQSQQTVFFRFTGNETEIQIDQREVVDYVWLSSAEILHKIEPVRKPHAKTVLSELKNLVENLA